MLARLSLLLGFCRLLQVSLCATGFAHQGALVGGEVLVKFMDGATETDRKAVEYQHGLVLVKHHASIDIYHYRSDTKDVWTLIANIRSSPHVYFAEPNYVRERQSAPNDEFYEFQWYLPKIGWEDARVAFTGTTPITVAVIDSGVTKLHRHLDGYRVTTGEWDFVQNDGDASDESGHGTMVAGIITGATGDGKSVAGISPNARILPLRVFDNAGFVAEGPSVDVSVLIAALDRARTYGARIINLSLGGSLYSFSERLALSACDNAGILLVCAAGNGDSQGFGVDNDINPTYPASYDLPGIVSVAATDDENKLAEFSNFGISSVDIAAPGQFIVGCDVPRQTLYEWDFSTGSQGWTSDVISGNGWIWSSFLGDWGIFSRSSQSWGFYVANSSMFLDSPLINLSGYRGARAEIEFSPLQILGFGDYLSLTTETSSGSTFVDLIAYPWSDAKRAMRDISHLDGQVGWLSIHFRADLFGGFLNTGSTGMLGITNVRVTVLDASAFATEAVWYADGTSFAAPIVSGVAAMMMSQNPQLTHHQVKQKLLETGSPVSALSGKIVTGAVVNAQAALAAAAPTKQPQTISFAQPPNQIFAPNKTFTLSGTATSGEPVGFSSSNPNVLSISGNTATIKAAGSVTITASQGGNANYNPAPSVARTLTVAKAAQSVSFTQPANQAFAPNRTFTLVASNSSGRPVTFLSGNSNVVTISNNVATIRGAGSVTITATNSGNANYNAGGLARSVVIGKGTQRIRPFAVTNNVPVGASLTFTNTNSTARLPVAFERVSGPVTVSSNRATVTGVGTVVLRAVQSGNTNYNAAVPLTNRFTTVKAGQTITWTNLPGTTNFVSNRLIPLGARSSSGLLVTYTSARTNVLQIVGTNAVIKGRGTNTITASQSGNTNYNAAINVVRTIVIR